MFGVKYSRTKFWTMSLLVFLIIWFLIAFATLFKDPDMKSMFLLIGQISLINILANRIRDYGSSPWLVVWSLIPFVGLIQALYFRIKHKKI